MEIEKGVGGLIVPHPAVIITYDLFRISGLLLQVPPGHLSVKLFMSQRIQHGVLN